MGQTTDELISLAHQVTHDPPHREMDMLLTAGERISMALLSMALADLGIEALSFTGSQSGIITDSSHRRARIRRILGDRIRATLASDRVAIVAGFQGVSESKEITTLGRGGSDTTAVALAAVLEAERCEIYTDVDGVYSADPRLVQGARLWKRVPADHMVELAVRGAGVLHPRSVELARQFGVPLSVRSSLSSSANDNLGTDLMIQNAGMEEFDVTGVTADDSKALIRIELMRPTVLSAVWDTASHAHLSIVAPQFSGASVQFFMDRDSERDWIKPLQRLAADGFVKSFQIERELVPVSVVGNRFAQDGAALGEIMETLAQSGIFATMGAASALAITVAVPKTHAEDAVRALHTRYFPEGESAS
jgi:aspartate kinase